MINAGWANDCGVELFTIGWVPCAQPAVGGGGDSRPGSDPRRRIYAPGDHPNKAQAIREDEELMAVLAAYLSARKH